jgi:hypothetical protein
MPETEEYEVERVQTGVRIEKRLLKVLKGLAEYHDLSLGDLLEGIVLHAFDGKGPVRCGQPRADPRPEEDLRPGARQPRQPPPPRERASPQSTAPKGAKPLTQRTTVL